MDFHCHLDLYSNAKAVHAKAAVENEFTWLVTTSPRAFEANSRVLPVKTTVLMTPGLHPEIAHERAHELDLLLAQIDIAKGVGEVGLDGSPRFRDHFSTQKRIFDAILARSAKAGGRALSIHSRRAVRQVLAGLEQHPDFGVAVLHWFSGSLSELKAATQMGCWFSVGPAMFNSTSGRQLVAAMARNKVLPESDGPFATLNGTIVDPWCLPQIAKCLSKEWEISVEEAASLLVQNGRNFVRDAGF